jgi:hypothetical protein
MCRLVQLKRGWELGRERENVDKKLYDAVLLYFI